MIKLTMKNYERRVLQKAWIVVVVINVVGLIITDLGTSARAETSTQNSDNIPADYTVEVSLDCPDSQQQQNTQSQTTSEAAISQPYTNTASSVVKRLQLIALDSHRGLFFQLAINSSYVPFLRHCSSSANLQDIQEDISSLNQLLNEVVRKGKGLEEHVPTDEIILRGISRDGTLTLELAGKVIEDIRVYSRTRHVTDTFTANDEQLRELVMKTWRQRPGERYDKSRNDGSNENEPSQAISRLLDTGRFWFIQCSIIEGQNPRHIIPVFSVIEKSAGELMFDEAERISQAGTLPAMQQAISRYEESYEMLQQESLPPIDSNPNPINFVVSEINRLHFLRSEFRGRPPDTSDVAVQIAEIYKDLGEFNNSLNAYNRALTTLNTFEEPEEAVEIYTGIADIYILLGQNDQANIYYRRALSESQTALERKAARQQQHRQERAREDITRAESDPFQQLIERGIQQAISTGTPQEAVNSLRLRAQLSLGEGDYPRRALEALNQSLQLVRQLGDKAQEAEFSVYLARIYGELGQTERGFALYQRALTLWQEVGYRSEFSSEVLIRPNGSDEQLIRISSIYQRLNQHQESIEFLKRRLLSEASVPPRQPEAVILQQMAWSYLQLGQTEQALKYLDHAAALFRQYSDTSGEAGTLIMRAAIYTNTLQQHQRALSYAQQAADLFRADGDLAGEAHALIILSWLSNNLKQKEQAIRFVERAIALFQETGNRAGQVEALTFKGAFLGQQDNFSEAITTLKQAVDILESFRGDIKVEELASSLIGQQIDVYDGLIQLLWETERYQEAFEVMEQSRARAFLSQLANGRVDLRSQTDTRSLEQETLLRSEITRLHQLLGQLKSGSRDRWEVDRIEEAENQLNQAQQNYEALLIDIRVQSPRVASLVSPEVASLKDVQRQIPPNTTLVEYYVSKDRILAFVITHDSLNAIPIEVTQAELTEQIQLFRDFADLSDAHPAELQQLHQWLIAPLKEHLNTNNLIVVPHGVLHYLPFTALTDGSRYLNDDYVISLLPSANTLQYLPQQHNSLQNTLLALGNPVISDALPPLRYAQAEVEAIAHLFHVNPFLGRDATETKLRSQASNATILHLSVHGEYNPINPLFSTLYLAADDQNDGRLEVHEIYGLDLTHQTNLVVLSACQTNIGQQSRGDEVVGLNRAFLYAGTPAVMSSLWNVDDTATALLMEQFYTHLQSGSDPARALQQAQRDIQQKSAYAHPYFWSAFSLTGLK